MEFRISVPLRLDTAALSPALLLILRPLYILLFSRPAFCRVLSILAGARGYILKESSTAEIIRAIREVHNGRFFLSPAVTRYIVDSFVKKVHGGKKGPAFITLTTREKQILQLLAEGFSSRDITEKLYLSLNTVCIHKKSIMHKLDIHSQVDLVRYAIKEGISKL